MTEMDGGSSISPRLTVRLADYESACSEYENALQEYRTQSNLLNVYLTLFTGLVVLIASGRVGDNASVLDRLRSGPQFLLPAMLVASVTVLLYLYSLGVDIIYNLCLVEARRAATEKAINLEIRDDLMLWDSRIVRFFNEELVHHRDWINPSYVTAAWSVGILLAIGALHVVLAHAVSEGLAFPVVFSVSVLLALGYSVFQYYLMQTTGRRFIFERVYGQYGVHDQVALGESVNPGFTAYATFAVGFVPFCMISLELDALFPWSNVDIPMLTMFTISIGDALLLPAINWRVHDALANDAGVREALPRGRTLALLVMGCLVLAAGLQTAVHAYWFADPLSDFLALKPGQITLGGWWHLAFSIAEGLVLLFAASAWCLSLRRGFWNSAVVWERVWVLVAWFSWLMPANFAYQAATALRHLGTAEVLQKAALAAAFPLAATALLIVGRSLRLRGQTGARAREAEAP